MMTGTGFCSTRWTGKMKETTVGFSKKGELFTGFQWHLAHGTFFDELGMKKTT
jgi:hypothetical protein